MNSDDKTLLVIRTIDQLPILDRSVPDWPSRALLIISGHPTVEIELRKRGVSFVSLYDAVPISLFKQCEAEVNELTDRFTDILNGLWPDEPSLIEGLRPNINIAAQDFVRSRITLEALTNYAKPQTIWIVSNLDVPRILDVELSSDIFDAMLLQWAKKCKAQVRLIYPHPARRSLLRRAYRALATPRLAHYVKRLFQLGKRQQQEPDIIAVPPKTSRRRIMLLGSDFDFEYQVPLVQKIRDDTMIEPVHVFLGDYRKWMQDDTYRYMAENPDAWIDYGAFTRQYPTRYKKHEPAKGFYELLGKAPLGWQDWLASPYLKFQLKWMFMDAPRQVLQDADEWETLFGTYRPDLAVLMQDSTYTYAGQSVALKRVGVKTVLLPHSAIVNATPVASRFLSEQAFVWGEIMQEELEELGIASARIQVTGIVKAMQKFMGLQEGQREQRLESLELSPRRKTLVMVTSGSFERWMRPYVDVKRHIASIEAVIRYCLQRSDTQLIIKTHPRRDYPAMYNEMIARLSKDEEQSGKVKVITKANLFDILALADAVISPNTHTTASLEALVAGQPIVYISTARIYDKGFSWVKYGGCLVIDNVEDIPRMLDAALSDEKLREKLIDEGSRLLSKYYAAEGQEAISRIARLLK